jgi:hypothetical protein
VYEVAAFVWQLVVALVVVSEVVAAGVAAVVGDDVALAVGGSGVGTGVWGTSRGGQGGADSLPGPRCGSWSWPGRSVEYATRSGERIRTTSRNGVFSAVDGPCTLFGAW